MKKDTTIEIIVILYVILFLYTGLSKIMEYSVFKEQIATSPLLAPISNLIALSLPWIEFSIVIILILPRWRLKGLYASLLLMSLFTGYIILMLLFNKDIPCSCGGVISELSWPQHIVFNVIFIAFSTVGIIMEKQIKRNNKKSLSQLTFIN